MLKIKWRMIQPKLRAIAKAMRKSKDNLCRQALIAGQETCNGEDLLTECMNICKNLNAKCISQGVPNSKEQLAIGHLDWKLQQNQGRTGHIRKVKINMTKSKTTTNNIYIWAQNWEVKFNSDKTKDMIVSNNLLNNSPTLLFNHNFIDGINIHQYLQGIS